MKKDYFEKIKNSKSFMRFDIIIYFFVLVLVISLFIAFTITKKKDTPSGFKIEIDGTTAFTYFYDIGLNVENEKYISLYEIKENSDTVILTVYTNSEKQDFNILSIDRKNKSVKITDANCSNHKDCVFFPPITNDNGSIICLPHKLIITPLSNGTQEPIIG